MLRNRCENDARTPRSWWKLRKLAPRGRARPGRAVRARLGNPSSGCRGRSARPAGWHRRSVCGGLEAIQFAACIRPPAAGGPPAPTSPHRKSYHRNGRSASRVEKQRSRSILTALSQRFSSTPTLGWEARKAGGRDSGGTWRCGDSSGRGEGRGPAPSDPAQPPGRCPSGGESNSATGPSSMGR